MRWQSRSVVSCSVLGMVDCACPVPLPEHCIVFFCVWTQIQRPADQWEYTILNEMHRRLDEETPSVDKVRTYIIVSWYSPQLNPGHLFSHGHGLNAGTICDGAECLHHDRHVFPGAAPVLLWDLAGHH